MTRTPVSVVIVSRQRPDALRLCLKAVARLAYTHFEVVVVADPSGQHVVADLPFADRIRFVPFDEANISAARNRGIARAAGQIIAFLDDDAVPETRWLDHLVAAFEDPDVAAAGGFVLGRNGISFQWKSRIVDVTGQTRDVTLNQHNPTVLTPPAGWAVKTEGTNMAVRRDVLVRLGGFDPAFRFYLDETDLNIRMAEAGYSTAIVPLAQVHHGFAASPIRRSDRTVRDLYQIAASTVVFLRKHCPANKREAVIAAEATAQRRRVLTQLVTGQQEPGDVLRLMRSWAEGVADGSMRDLTDPVPLPQAQDPFMRFRDQPHITPVIISGYRAHASRLRADAAAAAAAGHDVSLFLLSRSTLYHHSRFHPDGYWEHTGGLWGRSDRNDPVFRFWTLEKRVEHEILRIGPARF